MKIEALLGSVAFFALAQEAHVHGAWELFAAVDGNRLEVTVSGPLEDVIGFEHAPETEAEHEALESFVEKMANMNALAVPSAAAGCVLDGSASLTLPEGFDEHMDEDHDHDHDDDHEDGHHDEEGHHEDEDSHHGEHEGEHDEDRHDDEHDDHEGHHGEVDITYAFACSAPANISELRFDGFAAFPAIETVEAVMLTENGQHAADLTRAAPELSIR